MKGCQELFDNGYRKPGVYALHLSSDRKKTFVYCNNTETQSGIVFLYRYNKYLFDLQLLNTFV